MANSFQYVTWDGSQWTATLQDISVEIGIEGIVVAVIDPDYYHVPRVPDASHQPHSDKIINYIADTGQLWQDQCHAHDQGDHVSLTFEHFRASDTGHSDHEDNIICFKTWDGTCRKGTLLNIPMPSVGNPVPVDMTIDVYPCG